MMVLADQGAEVIKIEPPGTGDILRQAPFSSGGWSAMFAKLQPGKAIGGSYPYKICDTGAATCSNTATVTF